ncbi:MAG: polyribonucleotide nucleotidyltransferase [Thermoguttaceae bacterium]|nr:polyribonucleotide nucleotidyltransferase [Thermoguttaceae bacterium]MDW8080133.1 polyribonucleotide nucleotidyltransferase [Thermoguttaceae bacterium]
MKVRVERQIGDSIFWFETGELAKQAAGACLVGFRETVVLAAVTTAPAKVGVDFLPLTCDYRERLAAAGKFPGGFFKREGRPTVKEILTSRLMDRPIRPLFPDYFYDEVQIQALVLASDRQTDGDVLAMNAAAAALAVSPIPFLGPVASIRLGLVDGQFVPFPTHEQLESVSELDLVVSGTRDAIVMIEGFAHELPEDLVAQAIETAHEYIRTLCDLQHELVDRVGPRKNPAPEPPGSDWFDRLRDRYYEAMREAKQTPGKQARAEAVSALKDRVIAECFAEPSPEMVSEIEKFERAWTQLEKRVVRDLILEGHRPDGRGLKDLREIVCKVDVLPRVHGSALFQRGETQALVTVTLGTSKDEQKVDGLTEEDIFKKFMLDYYFPPFCTGECRPIRGPGRREIGHGALAERSLKAVLPDPEEFPYTIRVISDILESNGSSSMASVCGATLGLMAAGVPITSPVAGVSIGLVKEPDRWVLMTDIIGDEDHFGDMDFKVAGTPNGVTGMQLDLKIRGIDHEIIRATLAQAREARMEILKKMLTAIGRPRPEVSEFAPRILRTKIDPEKIGLLIGPGGKTVRQIQEATDTLIEIQDDGTVTIAGGTEEAAREALRQVQGLTATVEVGKIYEGRVTAIKDFGAFIEILPGRDGLCHISELAEGYVSNVSDVCKVGDKVQVKVIAIDDQDRIKLSRRIALRELSAQQRKQQQSSTGSGREERGRKS